MSGRNCPDGSVPRPDEQRRDLLRYGVSGLQSALVAQGPEHLDGAGVQVD